MFAVKRILRHRIETDGEGITTLVGLAYCPLSCKYCLNKRALERKDTLLITPEEMLELLMEDACYFVATGGGVTFGGGEPLLQYKDLIEFAKIKPEWIRMSIETSLQVPGEIVDMLVPYVDQWIVDIKTLDPDIYKAYTGWPPDDMLKNLNILSELAGEKNLIRIPIIPNYKDRETALKEEKIIREMGFVNTDVFEYVIRS